MYFTEALKQAKLNKAIAIESWGDGKFVFYSPERSFSSAKGNLELFGKNITYSESMMIRTADGKVSQWRPSTTETNSSNWVSIGSIKSTPNNQ